MLNRNTLIFQITLLIILLFIWMQVIEAHRAFLRGKESIYEKAYRIQKLFDQVTEMSK
jgi:ABC-type microcin C transport system permease subunit YejE